MSTLKQIAILIFILFGTINIFAQTNETEMDEKEVEKRLIKTVEKVGWQVSMIESDGYSPSFAYTVGLTKTFNHPEIIMIGLDVKIMGEILNIGGDLIKEGKRFELNKVYSDFLNGYDCKFVEVHKDYYSDYLGYSIWFNKGKDFRCYQLVWPNSEGKYPSDLEKGSDFQYKQPLLDRNMDFKFLESENLATFTTRQVMNDKLPILYVYHDKEGDWQFLCGTTNDSKDMMIVSLKSIIETDNSLNELHNLGTGEYAWRDSKNEKWSRAKIEE